MIFKMKFMLTVTVSLLTLALSCGFEVIGNYTELPDLSGVSDSTLIIKRTKISKLQNDAFVEMPQISSLTMMSNPLSSVERYAFRGLEYIAEVNMGYNLLWEIPNFSTVCKTLETIDLTWNYISEIDTSKFSGCKVLTILKLKHNLITKIPNSSYYLYFTSGGAGSKLKEFDLSENKITEIQKDAFKGLDALEILNLAKNEITAVANFNLESIKSLNLMDNQITSIPDNLFKGSVIETLDLSKNDQCETIPDLQKVQNTLKTLSLSQMNIKYIPYGKLLNMTALKVLKLNSNELKAFGNVTASNLKELNLESNQITTLSGDDLTGVKNLVTLHLKNNLITKIPMFPKEMLLFRNLKMSYNKVRQFTPESFKMTPSIEHIDLSNNDLEGFPNVSSLPTIQELLVDHNGLRTFSAENVAGLLDCTILRLGNNLLTVFPNVSLIQTILLELYINNNPIKQLDPLMLTGPGADLAKIVAGQLDSSVTLKRLDASLTNITRIPDELLHVAKRLTHLIATEANINVFPNLYIIKNTLLVANFEQNLIAFIPSAALQGMSKLQTLTLSNNHLNTFPFEVLASMPNIVTLNLPNNDLTSLPILTAYDMRSTVLTVKVTTNPINCDRALCWLKDSTVGKIKVVLSDSPCSVPSSLTIKKWSEINASDLQCDTAPPIVMDKFSKSLNGDPVWSRTKQNSSQIVYLNARSRSDCGRQCMARLQTWKLIGCSGFDYAPGFENNCVLYV